MLLKQRGLHRYLKCSIDFFRSWRSSWRVNVEVPSSRGGTKIFCSYVQAQKEHRDRCENSKYKSPVKGQFDKTAVIQEE